uniref:Uncharacterized protein n=1 Tax=Daphnia magna TaxID=35525 RepID=A0A0P5V5P7_9CRUS
MRSSSKYVHVLPLFFPAQLLALCIRINCLQFKTLLPLLFGRLSVVFRLFRLDAIATEHVTCKYNRQSHRLNTQTDNESEKATPPLHPIILFK